MKSNGQRKAMSYSKTKHRDLNYIPYLSRLSQLFALSGQRQTACRELIGRWFLCFQAKTKWPHRLTAVSSSLAMPVTYFSTWIACGAVTSWLMSSLWWAGSSSELTRQSSWPAGEGSGWRSWVKEKGRARSQAGGAQGSYVIARMLCLLVQTSACGLGIAGSVEVNGWTPFQKKTSHSARIRGRNRILPQEGNLEQEWRIISVKQ